MNLKLIYASMFVSVFMPSCSEGNDRSQEDNKIPTERPEGTNRPDGTDMSIREIISEYYPNDAFLFGASAQIGYFDESRINTPMVQRYLKEFSYNTPENDFKQGMIKPTPTSAWKSSGYMSHVEAARKYGQVIRCHGPISPQVSEWVRDDNRTPEELEGVLNDFMTTLSKEVEKNKDVVKRMDVVNETFTQSRQDKGLGYDGKQTDVVYEIDDWFGPREGDNGWENPWPILGFEEMSYGGETFEVPRYIRMAFEIANEHAPSIKKIYNEHGSEIHPESWAKIKRTVMALKEKGIKIDGIGWQAHVNLGWEDDPKNIENLQNVINWCNEEGMEFHITELDVKVTDYGQTEIDQVALASTREGQAETIAAVVEVMLQNIDNGAKGVNMWVMNDRFGGGATFASLFATDGTPNPAYFKVKDLLLEYKLTD